MYKSESFSINCSDAASVTVVQPNAHSVWTKGNTYDIEVNVAEKVQGQSWSVDLMVLGANCESDLCLHDGVVGNVATNFDGFGKLSYTVPKNIVQYGEVR